MTNVENIRARQLMGMDKKSLVDLLLENEEKLSRFNEKMVDVIAVAEVMGVSVSWVKNSQETKARMIRKIKEKYGHNKNSAVRWPLSKIIEIRDYRLVGNGTTKINEYTDQQHQMSAG